MSTSSREIQQQLLPFEVKPLKVVAQLEVDAAQTKRNRNFILGRPLTVMGFPMNREKKNNNSASQADLVW